MRTRRRSFRVPVGSGTGGNLCLLVGILLLGPYASPTARADTLSPVLADRAIARELKVGEAHSYLLPLDAGEAAQVVVEQKGIDVLVEVVAPSGQSLMTIDLVRPQDGGEDVYLVGEVVGAYRIEVRASETDDVAGAYEIRLAARRSATERDRL